jgi:hypothetical protein
MANIYYGDNGFTRLNFKYPYEAGFSLVYTVSGSYIYVTGMTKSGGFTTPVAVGDIIYVTTNNSTTPNPNSPYMYPVIVSGVTSTTISFPTFSIYGAASLYRYALLNQNIVDINDTSNYYSTLGTMVAYPCGCGSYPVPGTPYPYALNPATDTLIFSYPGVGASPSAVNGNNIYYNGMYRVYNSGTWTVPINSTASTNNATTIYNIGAYSLPWWFYQFINGTYNAPITTGLMAIRGGTYLGAVTLNVGAYVTGGLFTSSVTINYFTDNFASSISTLQVYQNSPTIKGGTFTGIVSRNVSYPNGFNFIGGGNYTPTATCAISNGQLVTTYLPSDPGFAAAGGSYSPVITLSGQRNSVLGAGFP